MRTQTQVAGGNVKWYKYSGNSLEVSYKVKYTLTIQFSDSTPRYLSREMKIEYMQRLELKCPYLYL